LRHTVEIFRPRIVPPGLQLLHRNFVRCVSVDLVRAQKNKYCFRAIPPRRIQQVHGPQRVHLKVQQRNILCFVVRGLCRTMNDQVELVSPKQFVDGRAVANIHTEMRKPLRLNLQSFKIPQRVSCDAKKVSPHVVVYAHNIMSLPVEVRHRLRPDQSAAACNQYFHDENLPIADKHSSKSQSRFPTRCSTFPDHCAAGNSCDLRLTATSLRVIVIFRSGFLSPPPGSSPPRTLLWRALFSGSYSSLRDHLLRNSIWPVPV